MTHNVNPLFEAMLPPSSFVKNALSQKNVSLAKKGLAKVNPKAFDKTELAAAPAKSELAKLAKKSAVKNDPIVAHNEGAPANRATLAKEIKAVRKSNPTLNRQNTTSYALSRISPDKIV